MQEMSNVNVLKGAAGALSGPFLLEGKLRLKTKANSRVGTYEQKRNGGEAKEII